MVSAQIIIVFIAIAGFFATGGLSKISTATATAKSDFSNLRGKVTDFQQSIVDQPKTNTEQLTTKQRIEISGGHVDPISRNGGFTLGNPIRPAVEKELIPSRNRIALPDTFFDRGGGIPSVTFKNGKPFSSPRSANQSVNELRKRGGFGFT